jgi:hypothetical protein
MTLIQLHNASIAKISTLADKTLKVDLYLREIPENQMAELMAAYLNGKEGFEITDNVDSGKSQSQQIRNLLYRIWEKTTDRSMDSEAWIHNYMAQLIQKLKEKLI